MKPIVLVLGLAVLISSCGASLAASCTFKPIRLTAVAASANKTYQATAGDWQLELSNDAAPKPTDVFSEPPLIVRNRATGRMCSFDGGIWSATGFRINAEGGQLLAEESSGSTSTISLYDLAACTTARKFQEATGYVRLTDQGIEHRTGCKGDDGSTCTTSRLQAAADLCR